MSSSSKVVAIEGERECSDVPVVEDGGIQLIASPVIDSFRNDSAHVLYTTDNVHERSGHWIALNQI